MERIFELKIRLEGTNPVVWRQIHIPDTLSLYELHHAIQIAFYWTNSHLYSFMAEGKTIGNPDLMNGYMDGEAKVISDKATRINQVLKKEKDVIQYEYDFGDSWMHSVTLEKILDNEAELKLPFCTDGAMAAPPEDCGGLPGFENLKDAMKSKMHPEHKELVQWLGKYFDPEEFHLQQVNKELKNLKNHIKQYEKNVRA